jgi:hypothetical protein
MGDAESPKEIGGTLAVLTPDGEELSTDEEGASPSSASPLGYRFREELRAGAFRAAARRSGRRTSRP